MLSLVYLVKYIEYDPIKTNTKITLIIGFLWVCKC